MSTPILHLTFDDGPDPGFTPRLLALLAEHQVTATFFPLAPAVRESPGLIAEIVAAGHSVGLHGAAHLDHSKASAIAVETDTAFSLETLAGLGLRPELWRLPWGRRGAQSEALAAAHGLAIVDWDADTHDWRGDGWDDQPPEVKATARSGGIVLMHDAIGPGAPRTRCDNTLELTARLIEGAEAAGVPVLALAPQHGADAAYAEPAYG